MLKLEFPHLSHKPLYEKLLREWSEEEKVPTTPTRLFAGNNFEEFLAITESHIERNGDGVNSHLYFLLDENEIVGAIQIRHHINHPNLIEAGGHIGYGVAPKHRRKGYATIMLQLALVEAKKLGLEKILLTCDINNIGSNKVIQKNGGIFERKTDAGEKNRYWIHI